MPSIKIILEEFVSNYLTEYPDLYEVFDPMWRSPCETVDPFVRDDGIEVVKWRPIARRYAKDFAGLENAQAFFGVEGVGFSIVECDLGDAIFQGIGHRHDVFSSRLARAGQYWPSPARPCPG